MSILNAIPQDRKIDTSEFAKTSDLENLATKSSLSEYAKTSDLENLATKENLNEYAKSSDLDGFLTSDSLNGYAKTSEVSTTLENYVSKDDVIPVEKGGTGATSLSDLASSLGACKIVTGSYKGDGSTSVKINFGIVPKIFFVSISSGNSRSYTDSGSEYIWAIYGMNRPIGGGNNIPYFTWSGTTVNIQNSNTLVHVNTSGTTYYWVAIA